MIRHSQLGLKQNVQFNPESCSYILQFQISPNKINKSMQAICKNGPACHYFKIGQCKYGHFAQYGQQRCRNGPECYYFKKGKCSYYHPPQTYSPNSGAFKCPSGHFNTKLQLTGKPCQKCRNIVQGYGLQCTECYYYVCRKCTPVHHSQFCNGTQLIQLIPISKLKDCRKCNKLMSSMSYCPLKCNYFICKKCLSLEQSKPPSVKQQYVQKVQHLNEVDDNNEYLISVPKQQVKKQ